MKLLLTAVSTVLWGHLGVYDDHVVTYLRQVLLDNVLSKANLGSELARRWRIHNDIIRANYGLSPATSAQVYYYYRTGLLTSRTH